jgi:hypothetical protein
MLEQRSTSARQVRIPSVGFFQDEDDGEVRRVAPFGLLELLTAAFVVALVMVLAFGPS